MQNKKYIVIISEDLGNEKVNIKLFENGTIKINEKQLIEFEAQDVIYSLIENYNLNDKNTLIINIQKFQENEVVHFETVKRILSLK